MGNRYDISEIREPGTMATTHMKIMDTQTGRSFQFPASDDGIVGGAIRELLDCLRAWWLADQAKDSEALKHARFKRDAAIRSFNK